MLDNSIEECAISLEHRGTPSLHPYILIPITLTRRTCQCVGWAHLTLLVIYLSINGVRVDFPFVRLNLIYPLQTQLNFSKKERYHWQYVGQYIDTGRYVRR